MAGGKWSKGVGKWYKPLTRIFQLALFLARCKGCENDLVFEDEGILCRDCREKIAAVRYYDRWRTMCQRCGRLMDHRYELCGSCILQPPPYRKQVSYLRYEDLFKDLILKYKYGGIEKLKHLFVDYLIQSLNEEIDESFDYIIPVPPDRGRKREFHPVLEIAKLLSKQLQVQLLSRALIKIKETPPQAGLTRAQRLKNLDGAFKLKRPDRLKGKKLLLIDDVYTTGTTITKCAQLLVKQNADVVVLTLARS